MFVAVDRNPKLGFAQIYRRNAHDLWSARDLLAITGALRRLFADRGYDAGSLREWLIEQGCEPVIPPNPTRKNPHTYDSVAYKQRNGVERFFCT